MKRFSIISLAVLTFTPLTDATAQVRQPPIERGARVRVTGHFCQFYSNCVGGLPQRYVGTFVTWEADTLVTESNGDILAVPLNSLTTLEVSAGRRSQAGSGAGIGGVTGAVVGVVSGFDSCTDGFVDPGACALVGGLVFGVAGALLGALIGATVKTERWGSVPLDRLRVGVSPHRDRGFGLGLMVRF